MADRILAPSDVLSVGERIDLYISGNTPMILGPSTPEVRAAIDGGEVGVETYAGEPLNLQSVTSLLNWYKISVEVTRQQSVGEMSANVASVVDSNLATYWNVNVSEVRQPGNSLCDTLPIACGEVPFSTTASLVSIAVVAVVILILIN